MLKLLRWFLRYQQVSFVVESSIRMSYLVTIAFHQNLHQIEASNLMDRLLHGLYFRQESSIDFEMKLLSHIERHIFRLVNYLRVDCEIDIGVPTLEKKTNIQNRTKDRRQKRIRSNEYRFVTNNFANYVPRFFHISFRYSRTCGIISSSNKQ